MATQRQTVLNLNTVKLTHPGPNGVVGTGSDDTEYNMLSDFLGGTLTLDNAMVDASAATSGAKIMEAQNASAVLEIRTKSQGTNAIRAQDLTVFSLGGTSYLGDLIDLNLNLNFDHDVRKGVGGKWLEPQVLGWGAGANAEFLIPLSAALALQTLGYGTDGPTDLELALALTLNSIAFSWPMALKSSVWGAEKGQKQSLRCVLEPNGDETASTGVASAFAAAVNDPTQWLQADLVTHGSAGATFQGNFVWQSVSLAIRDSNIVETTYRLASQGAVTGT